MFRRVELECLDHVVEANLGSGLALRVLLDERSLVRQVDDRGGALGGDQDASAEVRALGTASAFAFVALPGAVVRGMVR